MVTHRSKEARSSLPEYLLICQSATLSWRLLTSVLSRPMVNLSALSASSLVRLSEARLSDMFDTRVDQLSTDSPGFCWELTHSASSIFSARTEVLLYRATMAAQRDRESPAGTVAKWAMAAPSEVRMYWWHAARSVCFFTHDS